MTQSQLTKNRLKKDVIAIVVAIAIVALSQVCKAQTTKPKQTKLSDITTNADIQRKLDSLGIKNQIYNIPADKNIQLLYDLLQAGYQGVSSSPHFSKDQADSYKAGIMHLDSILQPQIKAFHPDTVKKKTK